MTTSPDSPSRRVLPSRYALAEFAQVAFSPYLRVFSFEPSYPKDQRKGFWTFLLIGATIGAGVLALLASLAQAMSSVAVWVVVALLAAWWLLSVVAAIWRRRVDAGCNKWLALVLPLLPVQSWLISLDFDLLGRFSPTPRGLASLATAESWVVWATIIFSVGIVLIGCLRRTGYGDKDDWWSIVILIVAPHPIRLAVAFVVSALFKKKRRF